MSYYLLFGICRGVMQASNLSAVEMCDQQFALGQKNRAISRAVRRSDN